MTTHEKLVEAVIELASQLKESIQTLCKSYQSRPSLIEREEKAIRTHDFSSLLVLRDEYEALNEVVEREVLRLRALGVKLSEKKLAIVSSEQSCEANVPAKVSEILDLLDEICRDLKNEAKSQLALNILEHLLSGMKDIWSKFVIEKAAIDAMIEKNHTVMALLLDNYQKSYQFWYEAVEKCSSSYNARGQQSSGSRLSAFNVRA